MPTSDVPEPSTLSALLARIGSTLKAHNVPYMVIGGHAAILYGEPRLTRDVDITVGLGPDKLKELLDVVRDAGLVPATSFFQSLPTNTRRWSGFNLCPLVV